MDDPSRPPASAAQLDELQRALGEWLRGLQSENPLIDAVEEGEPGERRWYVRMLGDARDAFTVYLTLRQRNLHHETFFLPAPPRNQEALFEHLLRRNQSLRGVHFAIGDEDALFLLGTTPIEQLDAAALDRVLALHYEAVERCFRAALQIGFLDGRAPT